MGQRIGRRPRVWPSASCAQHNRGFILQLGLRCKTSTLYKRQGAPRTRGLTSNFPVTENMRARPSGVHTVGTGACQSPRRSFTPSLPPQPFSFHPDCWSPQSSFPPRLCTHPGAGALQGRRYRSRGRGGSIPRSLKTRKAHQLVFS